MDSKRFHLWVLFFFLLFHTVLYRCFWRKKEKCYQRDADSLRLCSIRLLFCLVIVSASLGCMSALLKGFFCAIAEVERDLGFRSWSKWGIQCRLSEDLNCRMVGGCGESATKVERKTQEKTLELTEMPSGWNTKDWWAGRKPLGGIRWVRLGAQKQQQTPRTLLGCHR